MRTYIDRPLTVNIAVWPGDTPFSLVEAHWDTVRVGSVHMSLHTGTHIDAPRHLQDFTAPVTSIPDDHLCGDYDFIDATGQTVIGVEMFQEISRTRVLIKTSAWLNSDVFPLTFPVLSIEAATFLVKKGIQLLGIDLPSVDYVDSKDLLIHHILIGAGVTILEGLDLSGVSPTTLAGSLMVVPFNLPSADAAPVRAWIESTLTPAA